MKEKLTLVTSESQLRPGLLVEVRPCRRCDRTHSYFLVRSERDGRVCGTCGTRCTWWLVANSYHGLYEPAICTVRAIPERRLYIVETGLDVGADAIEGHRLYSGQPRVKERAR